MPVPGSGEHCQIGKGDSESFLNNQRAREYTNQLVMLSVSSSSGGRVMEYEAMAKVFNSNILGTSSILINLNFLLESGDSSSRVCPLNGVFLLETDWLQLADVRQPWMSLRCITFGLLWMLIFRPITCRRTQGHEHYRLSTLGLIPHTDTKRCIRITCGRPTSAQSPLKSHARMANLPQLNHPTILTLYLRIIQTRPYAVYSIFGLCSSSSGSSKIIGLKFSMLMYSKNNTLHRLYISH